MSSLQYRRLCVVVIVFMLFPSLLGHTCVTLVIMPSLLWSSSMSCHHHNSFVILIVPSIVVPASLSCSPFHGRYYALFAILAAFIRSDSTGRHLKKWTSTIVFFGPNVDPTNSSFFFWKCLCFQKILALCPFSANDNIIAFICVCCFHVAAFCMLLLNPCTARNI